MGKTSLKTFVCSFVLSLFTILCVNKEFFGVSHLSNDEIKIPNKNISLFFKDMPSHTIASKTIPIKKIALTVPLPPQKEEAAPVPQEDLIPLTFAQNDIEFDLPEKPATVSLPEVQVLQPQPPQVKAQETVPPPEEEETGFEAKELEPFSSKLVQAKVQIIRPNEKKIAQRLKQQAAPVTAETVSAQAEIPLETSKTEQKDIQKADIQEPAEEPHLLAAVPDEEPFFETEEPTDEEVVLPPTFKVAKAAANPDISPITKPEVQKPLNEPENLLIPLQKDSNSPIQTTGVKVSDSPENNQLAMLTDKTTIRSMEESMNTEQKAADEATPWQTMAAKNNESSTWVAAKGSGHQKNRQTAKEKYYRNADTPEVKDTIEARKNFDKGGDVKLAAQVVKNLLIPIPEDILNDPDLTPQLVSSEKDKEIEQQLIEQESRNSEKTSAASVSAQASHKKAEEKSLLKSITSIFSKDDVKQSADNDEYDTPSLIGRFTGAKRKKTIAGKILPTEIRLAFQPNRAEISGVTLRWIQAFANKTIEDSNAGLEIRIDGGSSYQLQQKRLNLLHNILTNNGVDYRKINTVFTTREPNSFIIRTVRLNNDKNGGIKEDNEWQDYYKAW